MLALLRVSRGVYGDPPRPFSPSLRGIRCRSSSSNSNSSSFKHPLAKLLPAGHRQVVAGSRYRNCQLPITCNSWPASVSGRSLVLCYRINPPSVTTEPRNRAGSHGRNWTPYLLPRKRLPESESRWTRTFSQLFDIHSFYFWPGFLSSRNYLRQMRKNAVRFWLLRRDETHPSFTRTRIECVYTRRVRPRRGEVSAASGSRAFIT